MNKDNKLILKNILVFGAGLTIMNIILSLILQQLSAGKSQEELMASITMDMWLWDSIRIGILV